MKHSRDDHERKEKYDSSLSEITRANNTHGTEYVSIVYIIDFIKNGEIILTKEKYNIDGPY